MSAHWVERLREQAPAHQAARVGWYQRRHHCYDPKEDTMKHQWDVGDDATLWPGDPGYPGDVAPKVGYKDMHDWPWRDEKPQPYDSWYGGPRDYVAVVVTIVAGLAFLAFGLLFRRRR